MSVARLAMEHGLNANLVFKWRRSLRAGEYDPVGLLPVKVEIPATEIVPTPPVPTPKTVQTGTIEISVGNARVRIDGTPDESTLTLVLRMLRGGSA
ncbi:transposase IS3/IS911 family protein [Burkholderia cepacia GG4]|uniref:Transposase IS3/IS911 family protein n=1 Tax=Burkholderia cepacia GG4 TaxID=1009846 RepID=A0A9W3PAE3_BURCE|nr:transposase IS3/IS911 family protein [Burkholderia cepacia GG4]